MPAAVACPRVRKECKNAKCCEGYDARTESTKYKSPGRRGHGSNENKISYGHRGGGQSGSEVSKSSKSISKRRAVDVSFIVWLGDMAISHKANNPEDEEDVKRSFQHAQNCLNMRKPNVEKDGIDWQPKNHQTDDDGSCGGNASDAV